MAQELMKLSSAQLAFMLCIKLSVLACAFVCLRKKTVPSPLKSVKEIWRWFSSLP